VAKEDLDVYIPTTKLTVMVENLTDSTIKQIENLNSVCSVKCDHEKRITVEINQFSDNRIVNEVIRTILENNGVVTSIATNDPSLEDVFVDLTSKKYNKEFVEFET